MSNLNELFVVWLNEWYKEASAQNSKSRFTLKKAIESIQSHPEQLQSATEAGKLKGIGDVLVKRLHEKLIHCNHPSVSTIDELPFNSQAILETPKKPRKKRATDSYIPKYRSGAYAILCALFENGSKAMTKEEIMLKAQIHCDVSFTIPQASFHYTAWSSIKGLIEKELVYKHPSPILYELSDEGRILASKLLPLEKEDELINDALDDESIFLSQNQTIPESQSLEDNSILEWEANSFEVCCLIDSRERQSQSNRDAFLNFFRAKGMEAQNETLEIGDFLWVAVLKNQSTSSKVVLDVIVERKRHDDFVSSLVSGRLQEQRHRLVQCGVKKVIYLLEGYQNQSIFEDFGITRIRSAIFELQTTPNFIVKCTKNFEESCIFLQSLHKLIQNKNENLPIKFFSPALKDLLSLNENFQLLNCSNSQQVSSPDEIHLPFSLFQSSNSKSMNLTLKDIFTRQLISLKGMTAEKAQAITQKYSTIHQLRDKLKTLPNEKEKIALLTNLSSEKQKIGNKLGKAIYKLFEE